MKQDKKNMKKKDVVYVENNNRYKMIMITATIFFIVLLLSCVPILPISFECESEDNMLFYTAKTNLVNYLNHGEVYFVKDVAGQDKEAVFILPDDCEML